MKRIMLVCVFFYSLYNIHAQINSLSKGASLLFRNVKCKLTVIQENKIFDSLAFKLSKDGKQFILDDESADYLFDAAVYPTDLNKDGLEEIFIVFGNSYTSGNAGLSVVLLSLIRLVLIDLI